MEHPYHKPCQVPYSGDALLGENLAYLPEKEVVLIGIAYLLGLGALGYTLTKVTCSVNFSHLKVSGG